MPPSPLPPYIRKSYIDTSTATRYAENLQSHNPKTLHVSDVKLNECPLCAAADIITRLARERDDLLQALRNTTLNLQQMEKQLAQKRHPSG